MKQLSNQMRKGLRGRMRQILKCWPGERFSPSYSVTFATGPAPDATQRVRIDPREVTIGESFSWALDQDGDAIELLGVSEAGLPIYSGKLNDEQKARWKRITG